MKLKNVYCPVCEGHGRKKLLFQIEEKAQGKINIKCRGCKEIIRIDLEEPLSRD